MVLYFDFGALEILTFSGKGIKKLFTRILFKIDKFTLVHSNGLFL